MYLAITGVNTYAIDVSVNNCDIFHFLYQSVYTYLCKYAYKSVLTKHMFSLIKVISFNGLLKQCYREYECKMSIKLSNSVELKMFLSATSEAQMKVYLEIFVFDLGRRLK